MKIFSLKQSFKQVKNTTVKIRNKKSRKLKATNLYIFILTIVNVILVPLVSFIGYIIHLDAGYNLPLLFKKKLVDITVYCDDLSLSPDEDFLTFGPGKKSLRVAVNGDGKYVCASNNITELVNKIVESETRIRLSKGLEQQPYLACGNESLVPRSGFLTVALANISENNLLSGDGLDAKLVWDKNSEVYSDTVVPYQHGEITIPEGRTYFVYASVHIKISQLDGIDAKSVSKLQRFSLRICRKTYEYEYTLLGETRLFNISIDDAVSSFRIASHLHLSRNDTIYVKVSNAKYVIPYSKGNTFGLFPL